jgi:hypothetical protein
LGTSLPSEEEVLIIPPTGKKGQGAFASVDPSPRRPARKPGIPKQDPDAKRSRRNAVAADLKKHDSQKSNFPKFQGAILMKKILLTVVLGVAVVAVAQNTTQPTQ